jgi:SOS response regulatory protein OraA/RecX
MIKSLNETQIEKVQMIYNFCIMAEINKVEAWKYGEEGLTKERLRNAGISDEVINFLKREHYISDRRTDGILWIASTANKYYPNRTIKNLKRTASKILTDKGITIEEHN